MMVSLKNKKSLIPVRKLMSIFLEGLCRDGFVDLSFEK